MKESNYHYRDAIRLLYLLTGLSKTIENSTYKEMGASHIFSGEKRLMALDFYIRYPDYLADRLLDEYDSTDPKNENILLVAKRILEGEEPDMRTILMVRWKMGAYQKIETALSILESRGLITTIQDIGAQGKPWSYLIYPEAFQVAHNAILQQPDLSWYSRQVEAIKLFPFNVSGGKLKEEQYKNPEYRNTPIGRVIPSIKDRVLTRLEGMS